MNEFLKHVSMMRTYLTHLANTRDYIKKSIERERERVATRYNREVRKARHNVKDMIMLHQKNTEKLKSR